MADIDYLDLGVTLSEPEGGKEEEQEPTLLVTASANLVRLRTCADTLQVTRLSYYTYLYCICNMCPHSLDLLSLSPAFG